MASPLRIVLIVACCLGLAGLVALGRLRLGGDGPPPSTRASRSNLAHDDCRSCHADVEREWATSYHARSWASDDVQAAFRHFGHDRQCESCHAPQPIFQRGLAEPVALRAEHRESGVNCLSCHALPDGRVAARRTLPDAPCGPVATPELSGGAMCAPCHVAIHKDWQASHYGAEGKTCQDCHMPAVAERSGGRSHVCLGSHDASTVRSGARLTCSQAGRELVVEVENHATGHNFPGERHNRILLLQVIERKRDGTIVLAEQRTIKEITPFRGESSAERVRVGETFVAKFRILEPPVTAEVQLLYKAFPWLPDREALIVHQALVDLQEDGM
jgi:hypothetical protein